MLRAYDAWDTSPLVLPRPTRLYSLAPIGVGTPMVESLTGYVVRLAEAHSVSAGLLYWKGHLSHPSCQFSGHLWWW